MNPSTCLVITTIQGSDNKVLQNYAKDCGKNKISFIVAGDHKSPKDFKLEGCEYLDIASQEALPFSLSKLLPANNYAKKNIAYLQAIKKGNSVIIETDDDNFPLDEFWKVRNPLSEGHLVDSTTWINVYSYFSDVYIWPRGFSLMHLKDPATALEKKSSKLFSPIQQSLVDENPDVDAIFRLTRELPFNFKKGEAVILGAGSVCPFNSQNTTWFKQAYPLMYLPSYCSFRMCDIWRSFIAQRILWTNDWHLSFHSSSAYQQRNEHDLIKDFEQEVSGYLHNHTIIEDLRALDLKKGEDFIYENLRACYKLMCDKNYLDKKELPLLEAWIRDLQSL